MAVKSRKVKIGNRCFYITVGGKDYILNVDGKTEGLVRCKDELGDYVVVNGEKYYIYLGRKEDSKFAKNFDNDKICVLVFDGEKFQKRFIKGELEDFKRLLGCDYIESPYFGTNIDKVGIYWTIDEEGSYTSPVSLLIFSSNGETLGTVNGKIVFSRVGEKGEAKGLSEKDILLIKKEFKLTLQRDTTTGNLLYRVIISN